MLGSALQKERDAPSFPKASPSRASLLAAEHPGESAGGDGLLAIIQIHPAAAKDPLATQSLQVESVASHFLVWGVGGGISQDHKCLSSPKEMDPF